MIEEEKIFGLGAGRLYIAPAAVSEAAARTLPYYAGPTKGGVTLCYESRIHEVTDYRGAVVSRLHYGDRVTLSGQLARLYRRTLEAILGTESEADVLRFGVSGKQGRLAKLRVILVSALPEESGGGEFVFSMIATAQTPLKLALSPERNSAYSFTLTAETDNAGMVGKLVIA